MTVSTIADWHAHIYYDADSKPRAQTLHRALEEAFPQAGYGRWHDRPVGPHPQGSYQVAFPAALFEAIVPWLALNRDGLTVFFHPNTGDDLADHRDHGLWLGSMPALDLSQFL